MRKTGRQKCSWGQFPRQVPDRVPGQPRAADPEWHVQRATKEKALKKIRALTGCSGGSGEIRTHDALRHAGFKSIAEADKADLTARIKAFQFRDIRPKAASETDLSHASKLLAHTDKQITRVVYQRVGETVMPTK
ncbi:hypothetical protein [Laribacter hongkongensis]|uniref:hypothetical protein n=1 Tax=Laribacter hongkongensis TaxID=168471 RepID=UPI001EFD91BF|nr:hypothetical protein [Laribacter hongkongensis]MCG9096591.1 hypothetical protein [Laribacter hongkongensis]